MRLKIQSSRLRLQGLFRAKCPSTFNPGLQMSNGPSAGHTLIELIGVAAVLVILGLALVPVVVRRIDRAAWTKEVNDTLAISNALVLQALRNYSIPDATTNTATGWAAAVANWTSRPVSQIATNNRGFARLFLYESGGWLATNL